MITHSWESFYIHLNAIFHSGYLNIFIHIDFFLGVQPNRYIQLRSKITKPCKKNIGKGTTFAGADNKQIYRFDFLRSVLFNFSPATIYMLTI